MHAHARTRVHACNDYARLREEFAATHESRCFRGSIPASGSEPAARFTTHYLGYVGKSRLSLNTVDRVHPRRSFGALREVKRVCSNTSTRGHESMRSHVERNIVESSWPWDRWLSDLNGRSIGYIQGVPVSFFSQSVYHNFAPVDPSMSENKKERKSRTLTHFEISLGNCICNIL